MEFISIRESLIDIAALQAFIIVAESGSFSRTAEILHLTQPAVSKRISTLETQLGASLFDRVGRKVTLTEAGSTLMPRARRILAELEDAKRALADLSGEVSGTLVVATSHHIGLHRLPPVLREFATRFPQAQLDMRFMDSEVACDAVAHGEVELAIATLPQSLAPQLEATPLWQDHLVIVVHPKHELVGKAKVTAEMLAKYPAILPGAGTFTRAIIDQTFDSLALKPKVAFSTNYLETIKMMASVGLGWSMLPRIMLDANLVELPFGDAAPVRELGVARHRKHSLSNAAKAMLEILHGFGDRVNE